MASYLQLLNTGVRATEAAFGRIDSSIKTAFQANERRREFDATMATRATEFQAEMAFKDRAFSAQQQQNLLAAENMRFQNEMEWKKFQAEISLEPLKRQEAQLRLEAAKVEKERVIAAQRDQHLNRITQPFDERAGAILATNLNPEFGDAYLNLKTKLAAEIASGTYDPNKFKTEFDNIVSTYGTLPPLEKPGYNPSVAVMMDKFGATAEAARYRASNPEFNGNMAGLISGAIMGSPSTFSEVMGKYGYAFTPDEAKNISMSRDVYNAADEKIRRLQADKERLMYGYNTLSETEKLSTDEKIRKLNEEINTTESNKQQILAGAIGGKFITKPVEQTEEDIDLKRKDQAAKAAKMEASENKTGFGPYGEPTGISRFDENYELLTKQSKVAQHLQKFPEAFGTPDNPKINFNSWNGMNTRDSSKNEQSFVKSLRKEIANNISDIPLDSDEYEEAVADGRKPEKTLEELISSPSFKEALDGLKGKPIEVVSWGVSNNKGKQTERIRIGAPFVQDFLNKFNMAKSDVESPEDVIKIIKQQKDPVEKRHMAEYLYSTVLAASAVDAYSLR